jgi:probable addiction module antidote protein
LRTSAAARKLDDIKAASPEEHRAQIEDRAMRLVTLDLHAVASSDLASAKRMTKPARDAGPFRDDIHKALSGDRAPNFDTILKVLAALGLKLHAEAVHE